MAISYNLMPPLQNLYRDTQGNILSAGYLHSFKDSDRVTPKPLYQKKDNGDFEAFANPLILDANGAINKPLYAIDDEEYFIKVTSDVAGADVVAVAYGYQPEQSSQPTPKTTELDLRNYILNAQYRFFVKNKFETADLPATTFTEIAPEGWFFDRSDASATATIEFKEFTTGQVLVPANPLYYLDFTSSTSASETYKDIIFKVEDVNAFANEEMTIAFWASSSNNNLIDISYIQNFGSNGAATNEQNINPTAITLTSTLVQYEFTFTPDDTTSKAIGDGNSFQIRYQMPINTQSQVSLANHQLNRSDTLLKFDYKGERYDTIERNALYLPAPSDDDIFSEIRWNGSTFVFDNHTGRVEQYLLGDTPSGYLDLDGTTYVRTDKVGSTNITYDRLYQAWANDSSIGNGNAFGYGSDGFYPAIYTNNALFTNLGTGTITAWADNNTTFTFAPVRDEFTSGFINNFEKEYGLVNTNQNNGAVTDATAGDTLFAVTVIQEGTASLPEITDIRTTSAAGLNIIGGQYFLISDISTDYYVWFKIDNVGPDPAVASRTGILVNLTASDSEQTVASKIKTAVDAASTTLSMATDTANIVNVENSSVGAVTASTLGTTIFIVNTVQVGTASLPEITDIQFVDASLITGGQYFEVSSTSTDYYIWYKKDGVGPDPSVGGRTGLAVELLSTDTSYLVALRTKQALDGLKLTKISTPAASTLSGGEYFLFYNTATDFYGWLTIDGVGTDPAVSGKTGVKIELTAADTGIQVAQKVLDAIGGYFFVVPDFRGYFARVWDSSAGIDPDADARSDRGDGTIGDHIGTRQQDELGTHRHLTAPNTEDPSYGRSTRVPDPDTRHNEIAYSLASPFSAYDGSDETRPINIYLLYCVKF